MRFLFLLIFFITINAQTYSMSDNYGFVYGFDHSVKNKKKAVFLKDGVYIVHLYSNRKKDKDEEDDDDRNFRSERFRVRSGSGIKFFSSFGSMYQRILIERRYVDGNFIITADNLRNDQIEEIKKSSLTKEEKDELIEDIEFTDFEHKAQELSYMVNIIKDHIAKGKLIRL
ncbi:MAG: hypothetical protein KDD94_09400 [Calditrichaeota bacterium]|nr:hypothetical protein [Calditrichota bacterium]